MADYVLNLRGVSIFKQSTLKQLPTVYQKTQGFLIFKSPAFWASIISKNTETGERLNLDAIETKKNVLVKFLLLALRMIRLFKNQ